MSDVFDAVRRAISDEQTRLWRAEERCSSSLQALRSRHRLGELSDEGLAAFEQLLLDDVRHWERRIIYLKQQAPPYAVDRGAYIELLPAMEPIDPRAEVKAVPSTPEPSPAVSSQAAEQPLPKGLAIGRE